MKAAQLDPAIYAAANAAADALDTLLAVETAAKDPAHYARVEAIARIAKAIRQRYATRVGQLVSGRGANGGVSLGAAIDGGGFEPLPGFEGDDQEINLDGGNNYVMAGGGRPVGNDMADILRESLMQLQRINDKKEALSVQPLIADSPLLELERLVGVLDGLEKNHMTQAADNLRPRIRALSVRVATGEAFDPGPVPRHAPVEIHVEDRDGVETSMPVIQVPIGSGG